MPVDGAPHPAVVVCHSSGAALRSDPFYQHLKDHLPDERIALFLFDRRGSGESQGDFSTASFAQLAQDVIAAAAYLQTRGDIDGERIGIYGISQGGWIAPLACAQKPDLAFQVIISGCGVSPAAQMDYAASYHLREKGCTDGEIERALTLRSQLNAYFRGWENRAAVQTALGQAAGEPWFEYAFLPQPEDVPEDVRENKWYYQMDYDPLPVWQEVRQPTLFLFAEDDRWVPVDSSLAAFQSVTKHIETVRLMRVKGAGHFMEIVGSEDSGSISPLYLLALLGWLHDCLQ